MDSVTSLPVHRKILGTLISGIICQVVIFAAEKVIKQKEKARDLSSIAVQLARMVSICRGGSQAELVDSTLWQN